MIQGLAVGGELVSAFVFLVESAPPNAKIFWGGMAHVPAEFGGLLGMLVAAVMRSSLSESNMASYGWRICFWFGILFGVAGIYLRRGISDSDEFEEALEHDDRVKSVQVEGGSNPVRSALEGYWRQMLLVSGVISVYCMAFYTYFIWWPFLLSDEYGQDEISGRFWINVANLLVYILAVSLICWYADTYQRGEITALKIGTCGILVWSIPGFFLAHTRTLGGVFLSQFIFAIFTAFLSSGMVFFMCNAFPVHVRTTSMGIAYNIGQALFAGTAPLISTGLATVDPRLPCVWGVAVASVSLYCLYEYAGREINAPLTSQLKVPLMDAEEGAAEPSLGHGASSPVTREKIRQQRIADQQQRQSASSPRSPNRK